MKYLVWLAAFIAAGCSTASVSPTVIDNSKYELMLTGTIDGISFEGIGVGSSARHHEIVISSAIAVNYFTVQTCHRSLQFTDVITDSWFDWIDKGKTFSWMYDESPTIEDSGDCSLRFCAFSKVVGSAPVACAVVDFKNSRYALPGENICNGADGKTSGTALCHTQVGLIERYRFDVPVVVAPQSTSGECQGKFIDADQKLFEYVMPEKECVIIFMEKSAPHRRAKLTVIPYDLPRYPGGN